jgi:hypothetical protein
MTDLNTGTAINVENLETPHVSEEPTPYSAERLTRAVKEGTMTFADAIHEWWENFEWPDDDRLVKEAFLSAFRGEFP